VIELTENQSITDVPGMQEALLHYRSRGFKFAIDDLGEGFSNLRMWSEVRPEFVKIDKHFVNGIADDRMKFHFVRAMQDLAETCKSSLVAEGIERVADFLCIRDMGIACGQGWFIARPAVEPARQLLPHVVAALAQSPLSFSPLSSGAASPPTAGSLLRHVEPLPHYANNEMAIARFEQHPDLGVLPVVNGTQPVGVINRHSMIDRFARPFRRELFGKKCCDLFMDQVPLVVDEHAGIQELAMMMALAPKHYMLDGFIITSAGQYVGMGSAHDLMATITEMQISAARYANPLTQLPGNVPINEHIDRMLTTGTEFVAAYLDIDNFKPYNDTFGYRRGDDVIQLLSQLICESVDQRVDFVGHIGGDDFFVIFQSTDWENRCWQLVSSFAERVESMTSPEESAHGGYMADNRRGEFGFQRLPTLSVGAVRVMPGQCESHREVAAAASAAKKQAKKRTKESSGGIGGSVFIERRRLGSGEVHALFPHLLN
jgi:diguanylate cyclase (GGDEF)-like protein